MLDFQHKLCCKLLRNICMCINVAKYDGTDIGKPYTVDNSTGTPIYTYINVEDYHPPSHAKRGATRYKVRLWPQGIVQFDLDDRFSSK